MPLELFWCSHLTEPRARPKLEGWGMSCPPPQPNCTQLSLHRVKYHSLFDPWSNFINVKISGCCCWVVGTLSLCPDQG